ncbi:phage tail sheath family protein [Niallia sp. 01092]|uniref:phage tail sheath family protein n=1 Tax=unclassified Niallia TaxID=2837522 RepID=UPI003FD68DEB
MVYNHGIRYSEQSTSIGTPVEATSGLTVAVGTAPINMGDLTAVNKPILAFSIAEAKKALGYSLDYAKYTLSEVISTHFELFGVAPVVFVNVLDPAKHKKSVTTPESITTTSRIGLIDRTGILLDSVKITVDGILEEIKINEDYTLSFNDEGKVIVATVESGKITNDEATLKVIYDYLDPDMVTENDIIGGYDAATGKNTGLELVNSVFPNFQLVPGIIIAPKYSKNPTVAAVMRAKQQKINGVFNAVSIADIDNTVANVYTKAPQYKNEKSLVNPSQLATYADLKLGSRTYNFSSQAAALMAQVDAANGDTPHVSPSNKSLQAESLVINGEEMQLDLAQANYLNANGIITGLNFIGGMKLWGNRTSAYPSNNDVKDVFIPIKRMFHWIGNTIILSFWSNVDDPTNRRLIDSFVDGMNVWLNGLTPDVLLGGRVEFRKEDNPDTNLLDGKVVFHVALGAPTPAEDIEFKLEYDVAYFAALVA